MLIELKPTQFRSVRALLGKYKNYPVVNAIIESNTPGRIFADRFTEPRSAFVLTHAGFSYLVGLPDNDAFNDAFKNLLIEDIFPSIRLSHDPMLICYPLADAWETPLKEILDDQKVYNLFRKQFSFNQDFFERVKEKRNQIPYGFKLHPINQILLDEVGADMFPWESPQIFLQRGFGYWLMKDDEIVCECSSVFVGNNGIEIGIHTKEKYQKQGLATITASEFISECLSRKFHPNWECWWDNLPSIALAQKLGFVPINDHPVFLIDLSI